MSTLACFGLGYCAQHYVAEFSAAFERIIGTTRTAENAVALSARSFGRSFSGRFVEMLVFDGKSASPQVRSAVKEASALLISAAPTEAGDPVLSILHHELRQAPLLRSIVLLSTVGVYGDQGGGWVDEDTPPHPVSPRGRDRIQAERAWTALGARRDLSVAVLRLAGIYGPGQNALLNLLRGRAKRITRPGQVFNRIHVADIAQAIEAAFARGANGIFNVSDDEPTPAGDPIVFAAQLLGIQPPPEIPFADAEMTMTPFAASFYAESKRVRNEKMKTVLGMRLHYPTYREGLRALYSAGDHKRA